MGVYDWIDRLEERQQAKEDYKKYKENNPSCEKTYLEFCRENHYRDF